jgi:exonuclease SbcD
VLKNLKVLCTADIHIGQQAYSKIDITTGLNTRVLHGLKVLDEMIDYAINNDVEVFAFAGDFYKNNLPSPTIQNEVNKRIKRLSDNNILSFILDGNHDVSKLESAKSALKTFSTLNISNIIHSKFLNEYIYTAKNNKKYKFVMLPTYATKEELEDIINNIDYTYPTIFIGHLTIRGALLNDWLIEDKEEYIDKDIFNRDNVIAVILGHLHKYQILDNSPLMFYTGSPDRIDFGEEKQEKGFVVLDIDEKVDYTFIPNNAEKFKTIKINIRDIEDNIEEYIKDEITLQQKNINDSITRIIIDMNTDQVFDDKNIYEYINQYSPKYILNIQKNYNTKKHQRNSNITSDLSIDKALELFYENKNRSAERIILGKQICNEVLNAE